jgi:uncharacterized protein
MSQPPDRRSYSSSPPTPRPPLDPQQRAAQRAARQAAIRRRRLIAGGVGLFLLVCIVIAIVVVATGGGSGKPGSGVDATPSPGASPGKSPKPTKKPTPAALPTPTAAEPLRFFAGGDSMGGEMGNAVIPVIYDTGKAKTVGWYKVSSGLSRPDFFNWPGYLKKYSYRYQAMALMMGTNDAQNMTKPDGTILKWGTAPWKAEYRKRVAAAMDQTIKSGVQRVYWVGMPVMKSVNFDKDMKVINAAFRDEAEKRKPKVRYIDTEALFSTDGAYDPRWRQPDGVHFNIAGTQRLADHIAGIIEREWHLQTDASVSP